MSAIEKEKYGPWALITGSSSGMGEEFARQLAAQGFNIVLVARRQHLIEKIAEDLESKYNIKARTIAADLSKTETINIITGATDDIEIGLLINNAAMFSVGTLVKVDIIYEKELLETNTAAPLQLTHYFGNKMVQQGRGGIIFVASSGGYCSLPYMANYMASKAYLISLGEALHYELKRKGVDVLVFSSGGVKTKPEGAPGLKGFDDSKLPEGLEVTPVVSTVLKALGKKPTVVPGLLNKTMTFVFKHFTSRKTNTRIFGRMIGKGVDSDLK